MMADSGAVYIATRTFHIASPLLRFGGLVFFHKKETVTLTFSHSAVAFTLRGRPRILFPFLIHKGALNLQ